MRLIDLDTVMNAFEKKCGASWKIIKVLNPMMEVLESMPTIEWIPCSERLPEAIEFNYDSDKVLFCTKDGIIYTGCYNHDYLMWTNYDSIFDNVVAWMPLPEPYRKDIDESNDN